MRTLVAGIVSKGNDCIYTLEDALSVGGISQVDQILPARRGKVGTRGSTREIHLICEQWARAIVQTLVRACVCEEQGRARADGHADAQRGVRVGEGETGGITKPCRIAAEVSLRTQ